jgi:hypothetical protein
MASLRTLILIVCASACTVLPGAAHAELRTVFGYTDFYNRAILEINGGATQVAASDQGWFDQFGDRGVDVGNYIAGVCGVEYICSNHQDIVYRDFFAFNLAGVVPQVSSASLLLWNPEKFDVSGNGYISTHDTETFLLHDVHTSLADLAAINSHRVDVFDDLATGTFYGERVMSYADNGAWVRVDLNAAALVAISNAAGGSIVLGGSLANVGPIPEPQTIVLVIGGLGWLGWQARRRHARPAA